MSIMTIERNIVVNSNHGDSSTSKGLAIKWLDYKIVIHRHKLLLVAVKPVLRPLSMHIVGLPTSKVCFKCTQSIHGLCILYCRGKMKKYALIKLENKMIQVK